MPCSEVLADNTPPAAECYASECPLDKDKGRLHEKSIVLRGDANVAHATEKKILEPLLLVVSQSGAMHRSATLQFDLL